MPVFDFSRIGIVLVKVVIFTFFVTFFQDFMDMFADIVKQVLVSIFSETNIFNGFNLGYFAGAIGLVDFLNNFLASTYVAFSFYVSFMLSIILFKYSIFVYSMLFHF